jgi:glutamate racemase
MKKNDKRPIGVFDSGVGGLTVARSIVKHLPNEDVVYFGDTARVPYGNKSKATIIRFSLEILRFLKRHDVKMVVVACNTASSFSLPAIKKACSVPVTGVIGPGVREAVGLTRSGRIGVIGTTSTIQSCSYGRELARHGAKYRLFAQGCPLFVPLVENGFIDDPITYEIAGRYLKDMRAVGIDTLILGCTHYPLLKGVISDVIGHYVNLVDSSFAVAREVKGLLDKHGLGAGKRQRRGKIKCFVSDDTAGFRRLAGVMLGSSIHVRKAAI